MQQHTTMLGHAALLAVGAALLYLIVFYGHPVTYTQESSLGAEAEAAHRTASTTPPAPLPPAWPAPLDRADYDARLLALAQYEPPALPAPVVASSTGSTTVAAAAPAPGPQYSSTTSVTLPGQSWPAATPYPHGGAILPFERIIAYYGNFYSRYMGILGEYPREEVLARLATTSAHWEAADPTTPVRPAIHYIAMVAQADAGRDGMYRAAMPDEEIEKAYDMAQEINGLLFIDLQVGLSTIERELPQYREFLSRPDVHLGIDPEFSMKTGDRPGTVIGTYDAADINFVINWLADIVREHKLPPKVLVIHRFTTNMVTNADAITPQPEVQVVIDMDGWGSKQLKRNTYRTVLTLEPVQFAGLKIFYKNDLKPPSTGIFTPEEALELYPAPIYIQYQ